MFKPHEHLNILIKHFINNFTIYIMYVMYIFYLLFSSDTSISISVYQLVGTKMEISVSVTLFLILQTVIKYWLVIYWLYTNKWTVTSVVIWHALAAFHLIFSVFRNKWIKFNSIKLELSWFYLWILWNDIEYRYRQNIDPSISVIGEFPYRYISTFPIISIHSTVICTK